MRNTQGPFSVHRTHDSNHNAEHVIRASDGSPLARVSSYMGTSYANRNANAELFAASSELLAALQELLRIHTGPKVNDEGPSYRAVVVARAAIAKATGTTP